ncbi:hypothetical protein [Haloarchaeobius sp. HRN-SO-5]|uniref:hypothetical protein n=1 Tax=Haloarchaeobius sp. HRN-SO-5 TaxID=3446118 RepID=UPI003EBF9C93
MGPSRRKLLGTTVAAGVAGSTAGCLGLGGFLELGGVPDIWIKNDSSSTRTLTVRVVRSDDDEELLVETLELDEDETREYEEVVGGYSCRVRVNVEDGPSKTTEWRDDDSDSNGLQVVVTESDVHFREV